MLPRDTASPLARVLYSDYLGSRLARKGLDDLAAPVDAAADELLRAARDLDDLERPLQLSVADREEAEDALDRVARLVRGRLAGRSVDAVREEPYSGVFPAGLAWYVKARVGDRRARFLQLVERMEHWLPADDPDRGAWVDAVNDGLVALAAAEARVTAARTRMALARTRRNQAVGGWTSAVEGAYGRLVTLLGRDAADWYFPTDPRRAAKRVRKP